MMYSNLAISAGFREQTLGHLIQHNAIKTIVYEHFGDGNPVANTKTYYVKS